MAADPAFASVIRGAGSLLGAAETNLQVPVNSSSIVTPGANGTKIEEVVVHAASTSITPTTAAGLVYLFVHDGASYHLYDTIAVTVVTPSATVAPFRASRTYTNLWLPAGFALRASQSVAANANILKVIAFGGDF